MHVEKNFRVRRLLKMTAYHSRPVELVRKIYALLKGHFPFVVYLLWLQLKGWLIFHHIVRYRLTLLTRFRRHLVVVNINVPRYLLIEHFEIRGLLRAIMHLSELLLQHLLGVVSQALQMMDACNTLHGRHLFLAFVFVITRLTHNTLIEIIIGKLQKNSLIVMTSRGCCNLNLIGLVIRYAPTLL